MLANTHARSDDNCANIWEVEHPAYRNCRYADTVLSGDALKNSKKLLEQAPAAPASYHRKVLPLTWSGRFRIQIGLGLVEPFIGKEATALVQLLRDVSPQYMRKSKAYKSAVREELYVVLLTYLGHANNGPRIDQRELSNIRLGS
jgi:hypothetical protein